MDGAGFMLPRVSRGARLTLWTVAGAVVGFLVGVYFVTMVGIGPGDRTDLLVMTVLVGVFAVAGFLWARR